MAAGDVGYTSSSTDSELYRHQYYKKEFLETIEGESVFDQFSQEPEIPHGAAGWPQNFQSTSTIAAGEDLSSVEFTGYLPIEMFDDSDDLAGQSPNSFDPFGTASNEAVSQRIDNIYTRKVNAAIEMYSKKHYFTRLKQSTSLDSGTAKLVRLLGDMVGRSREWLIQKLLLNNAVKNALGNALFNDANRDIGFIGANGKSTIAAAGGAGTPSAESTNVVAAPESLVGGGSNTGNVAPDWWTLDDIRVMKFRLDADRAFPFADGNYVTIVSPAIEERFIADTDIIRVESYRDSMEVSKGEMGRIYGMKIVKTRETGWVVGVQDDATHTEGVDTVDAPGGTDTAAVVGNADIGTVIRPRQFLKDLTSSSTDTYWQDDLQSTSIESSASAPLLPIYAFGTDAFGLLPLAGWNSDVSVISGKSKSDPANLYTVIAFSIALARAVLQGRHIKVGLGAVDYRTLSDFGNELNAA